MRDIGEVAERRVAVRDDDLRTMVRWRGFLAGRDRFEPGADVEVVPMGACVWTYPEVEWMVDGDA